jgi:tetratricopeptide (TPR) repeat protein
VYHFLGLVHLYRGDLERAAAVYKRSLELCQNSQIRFLFPYAAAGFGYTHALAGQVATGLPLLQEGVEQATAIGYGVILPLWTAWLAEAYLLADRPADASLHADRALALARRRTTPGYEAWALRLLGEIAAYADVTGSEQAEAHYREALALAEKLGMRPLVAHCHLGLGTLYQQIGRDHEAQAELTTAAELYRTMEMPFWLEKAETALAKRGAG